MKLSNIEFVNHASVILSHDNVSILSDPWFNGAVFNDGWRLLHEVNAERINNILKKITHIYISHEHPDHFSPSFFTNEKNKNILIEKNVKILFQETKDKRVVNFLKKQNYEVIEVKNDEEIKLGDEVTAEIKKYDFYDSLFIFKTPELKILNLNDCPLREKNEIYSFKKKYGSFDILLTQFSYAAWKGGVKNKIYRETAAKEKLESIENQARILNCKSVVPFASYIYFSNELNSYMNDSINSPEIIKKFFLDKNINIVILSPGEMQNLKNLVQKKESLDFWNRQYKEISLKPKDKFNISVNFSDLNKQFDVYKNRIFKKNSKLIILFLSKIKIMNFFQPLKIKLIDHKKIYRYSIIKGLSETNDDTKYDIEMHSQSLNFIFKNEFGFDTLTVNGCFEATQSGFLKSTKTLAIGNLNAMGLSLNFSLLLKQRIIFSFLKKLRKVLKKIN